MLMLIGSIIALVGSAFLFLASLGLIRMPDVYNRMQAGTKATTLGSMLVFAGFVLVMPQSWPRLVLLILFIFLTNPLSSHALARSAHIQGVPVGTDRDDLAEANAGIPEGGAQ
tara:strand:- start:820 stop:1158 length:339 start_codon:yes stop_codon:yes gene_type:complete